MSRPLIIEAAINGGVRKARNPSVPREPAEVAAESLRCLAAGAAIVHSHTEEPVLSGTGRHAPEPYLAAWRAVLAERPDALLYPTMPGGREDVAVTERYAHVEALAAAGVLRMGLVDPGTTNFGRVDEQGLPRAEALVYRNTYADACYMVETCRRLRLGISVSIFEPGFLRFILAYHQAGRLPRGVFIKLYFGGDDVLFGFPPLTSALDAYLEMLNGSGLPWLVSVQGGDLLATDLARAALERGGHLQVGLEPSGDRDRANIELVREAVALGRAAGREPASPDAAAALLDLPRERPG